jgi:hypothetical protein
MLTCIESDKSLLLFVVSYGILDLENISLNNISQSSITIIGRLYFSKVLNSWLFIVLSISVLGINITILSSLSHI